MQQPETERPEKDASTKPAASACCGTAEQATCCEKSEKSACCGTPDPESQPATRCGCR